MWLTGIKKSGNQSQSFYIVDSTVCLGVSQKFHVTFNTCKYREHHVCIVGVLSAASIMSRHCYDSLNVCNDNENKFTEY